MVADRSVLVLAASCFGAGFPVLAKKVKWLRIPPRVFFACKHFGTGVLIATAFVHLLPTAFQSLNDPCLPRLFTDDYPALPGVIGLGSLFSLFAIELWMRGKMGGGAHNHGSADGSEFAGLRPGTPSPATESPDEPTNFSRSILPKKLDASINHVEDLDQIDIEKQLAAIDAENAAKRKNPGNGLGIVDLDPETVDPLVYRKMAMEITLIEGGILFHSVFVGMTVSITTDGFIVLLIAILFHQTFEGLGLGSRIAAVPYPKGSIKPWLLVFAFGCTAPIGQAIGLITHNSYDPNSAFALILVGWFNAL